MTRSVKSVGARRASGVFRGKSSGFGIRTPTKQTFDPGHLLAHRPAASRAEAQAASDFLRYVRGKL